MRNQKLKELPQLDHLTDQDRPGILFGKWAELKAELRSVTQKLDGAQSSHWTASEDLGALTVRSQEVEEDPKEVQFRETNTCCPELGGGGGVTWMVRVGVNSGGRKLWAFLLTHAPSPNPDFPFAAPNTETAGERRTAVCACVCEVQADWWLFTQTRKSPKLR